jgi:hypothetical protein
MVVPTTLRYMSYYWAPASRGFATMRFLLPTFFIYAIAAVWFLGMIARVWRAPGIAGGAAILFLTICWGLPQSIGSLRTLQQTDGALAKVTRVLEQSVPPGSIVIVDNSLAQYLDFVGKWRLADESALSPGMRRQMEAVPKEAGAPSPMQPEKMADRLKRYEGLRGTDLADAFANDIWKWAGKDGRVFYVGAERSVAAFSRQLWQGEELKTVAKIEMPKPPVSDPGPGGGAGMGMRMPAAGQGGPADVPGGVAGAGAGVAGGRLGEILRDRAGAQGGAGGMMGRRFDALLGGEPLILAEWTLGS